MVYCLNQKQIGVFMIQHDINKGVLITGAAEIRPIRAGIPTAPYGGMGITTVFKTKLMGFEDMEGKNLEDVIGGLSKTANWLYWQLIKIRDQKSNICIFKVTNNVDKKKVGIGYKELFKCNLIIRLARQKYMLNPTAVIPLKEYYEATYTKWIESNKGGTK